MPLPIVASLWIGGSLSYLEQLCLKSFVDHGHRTILYTYGAVTGVPDGVEVMDANTIFANENYIRHARTGSPAVHADAFRYRMIEVQNVIWVDADVLCMQPWNFKDQWVFGWEKPNRLVCNAVLGLPRFSKTLAKLNDLCKTEYPIPPWAKPEEKERLEKAHKDGNPVHVSELEWGVWGPAAVTHFLNETGEMDHVMPQQAFFPISFKDRRDLLKAGSVIDDQLDDGCYSVHLWNRRLRRRLVTSENGVPDADSFLGRALARHGIDPLAAMIADEPPAIMLSEREETARRAAQDKAEIKTTKVASKPAPARSTFVPDVPATMLKGSEMRHRDADPSLPTVASLWIGGRLSFLEQVCLKSFLDWGHRTILYTYGQVDLVPDGVEVLDANKVFPKESYIKHKYSGSPALHSDVFRYRMIEQEDVIWIDADVLCMKPWNFDSRFVFGWEKPGKLVCGAVLGFPKSSKALAAISDFCRDEYPIPPWFPDEEISRLTEAKAKGAPVHVTELEWGVWGPAALTHFLVETGEIEHALPRQAFYPNQFKNRRDLLDPEADIGEQMGKNCFGVHLWNRRIRRRIITHENGIPHPESFVGQALIRHGVDPHQAMIPDEPPAHILAARAVEANKIEPAPDGAAKKTNRKSGENLRNESDSDNNENDAPGLASANPNVVTMQPKAQVEMPVIALQQSAEYQQMIDNLENRTGGIIGYLKDPETPIRNDKILVVTSMKNEAPFILEWIAYHKSIGVDHFLVYTNDCTDNTNQMLDRLEKLGHVTRRDNPWDKASGKKPQQVALKDTVKQQVYKDADWVLTIDVDEFVNIHVGDGTFTDLFRASNYPNVISFTWKFFGNKDIHAYEDRLITEQFTACAPEFIPKPRLGWGFKSMFHKSSPYSRIGVHRPLGIDDADADKVRWVNGSGRAMPDMLLTNNGWRSTKRSLGYRLATLNHYILRSADSFLVKRERGRINHTEHDQGIDYWARRNYATETDTRILARLPRMAEVLDELRGDAALSKLHEDAVLWHKKRVAHLLQQPDYKQLYDDLTAADRPDALEISKVEEANTVSELESAAPTAEAKPDPKQATKPPAAAKPAAKYKLAPATPLDSIRLISPPESAATVPVHERFDEARTCAATSGGFLWEGPENALMFVPRSKRLVVSFDNISVVREEGQRWPWGFKILTEEMNCSVLGVMATQRNWFRQEFVHDAFETLRDQGFFEQFDEVLFYGTSMGAFAALVYSQCSPGANVLAIAPQSTLNRDILPKDDRWGWTARLDWKGRFNDAADVTATAKNVTIIADPYFEPDFDQVSRIKGDNITWLKTPFMGHQLPNAFHLMGILKPLLYAAVSGTLTPELFYKLFRARRELPRFQHDILMHAEARGKLHSAIRVCEYTLKRRNAKNIARTLERLKDQLVKQIKTAAE